MNEKEMLELYPYINANYIRLHLQPDRGLLSWKRRNNLQDEGIIINQIGVEILQMIDGTTSTESIITYFARKYSDNHNRVQEIILDFINGLQEKYQVPIKFANEQHLSQITVSGSSNYILPMHVAIELTYKCNLECKHCYANSSIRRTEIMPTKRVKEILHELSDISVVSIELTGGEPTIHPEFFEILKDALGLEFDLIAVLTNGTLLTDETIEYIEKYKNKIAFQVDLHGSTQEYVSWFTGKSFTFEREIKFLKLLSSKGFLVRVATSITSLNLNQMDSIAKIAKDLGAINIVFSPVVPTGRALEQTEEIVISNNAEDYLAFINNIQRLRGVYGDSFVSVFEETAINQNKNCGAGSRSMSISPNGSIGLCQMSAYLFSFGSISEKNVRAVLESRKDLTLLLRDLPWPSPEECLDCKDLWFCYHCIARGITKAKEKGVECVWAQKYIKGTPLMNLLY